MSKVVLTFLALALIALAVPAGAQDATELMKDAHLKMYYPADDGTAQVKMVITDKRGKTREREFTIRDFVPRTYWRIEGQFGVTEGPYSGFLQRQDKIDKEKDPGAQFSRSW